MRPGKRGEDDVYEVGTLCKLISHSQNSTSSRSDKKDEVITAIAVEGRSRFTLVNFNQTSPYRIATINLISENEEGDGVEVKALRSSVQQALLKHLKENLGNEGNNSQNGAGLSALLGGKQIKWPSSASLLADMVGAGLLQLTTAERQQVLENLSVRKRLEVVLDLLTKVGEAHRISNEINSNIRAKTEEEFREVVLRRQMQELQNEMRKLKSGKKGSKKNAIHDDADAEGSTESGEETDEEEDEEEEDDVKTLKIALSKAGLSAEAQKISKRELRRLGSIQPHHPEYIVCRTYLETLAGLPWNKSSEGENSLDMAGARAILEADHYGLEMVKRRVLEFLAVHKMRGDMKGPILCLHGPPGVGKTSLGKSVAKALGRQFHRVALGGVRDEAELRGHRRTYIGSMPGVIIQSLTASKVNNPVILLDEVDKLTKNNMFNPSGALLEILDPEQNHTFKDNYVNCSFDLSKCLFIATCNEVNTIDRPLLDRMEILELSGYTIEEKVAIAERHLIPKQLRTHALHRPLAKELSNESQEENAQDGDNAPPKKPLESAKEEKVEEELGQPLLVLTPSAVTDLVSKWTAESGVRSLERKIAEVCRWAALRMAGPGAAMFDANNKEKEEEKERALADCGPNADGVVHVDSRHLPYIVGVEIFEPDLAERLSIGVAMGLGVSSAGGQLLFVEATRHRGHGKLTVTGQLGDVMRESVLAAMTLLRSMTPNPKSHPAEKSWNEGPLPYSPMGESPSGAALSMAGARQASGPILSLHSNMTSSLGFSNGSKFSSSIPSEQVTKQVQTLFSRLEEKDLFGSDDVHVHFPAGGIPKDGPSAGVTTTLALASLLLGRPVRSDTAVTGEITLRGHVLPVGGIKDKVLAAHRAGLKHVLLPHANQRHAANDLPASVVKEIELYYVKHIDEALYWMFCEDNEGSVAPLLSKL